MDEDRDVRSSVKNALNVCIDAAKEDLRRTDARNWRKNADGQEE